MRWLVIERPKPVSQRLRGGDDPCQRIVSRVGYVLPYWGAMSRPGQIGVGPPKRGREKAPEWSQGYAGAHGGIRGAVRAGREVGLLFHIPLYGTHSGLLYGEFRGIMLAYPAQCETPARCYWRVRWRVPSIL